jgi:hypothetical protein
MPNDPQKRQGLREALVLHAASPKVPAALAWMREAPRARRVLACMDEASVRLLQAANRDLDWWRFFDATQIGLRFPGDSGPIEKGIAMASLPWPDRDGPVEVWGPEISAARQGIEPN